MKINWPAFYEQLSKIAPTIVFDTFAPLEERLPLLGDALGKKPQAEQWLAEYNKQEDQMWKELQAAGLKPGRRPPSLLIIRESACS